MFSKCFGPSSLAQEVEIFLDRSIARVDFQSTLIFGNCLSDALKFAEGVTSTDSNSQIHLLKPFSIGSFRIEPILVVLDQSDRFVTFGNNSIKLILGEKTGDFVYIDADVVKSGSFSCDLECQIVQFKCFDKLSLFQLLIGFILILCKCEFVKFFLDLLQSASCFTVGRL